jgi:hypothetical protein
LTSLFLVVTIEPTTSKGGKMEKQKAVIITTDGDKSVVEFDFGKSYQILSDAVGGMIECVGLEDADVWCNENGIAEGLPLNMIASAIYSDAFNASNPILGNVIITGSCDDEGETLGLTDEQVAYWLNYDKKVIPTTYLLSGMYN